MVGYLLFGLLVALAAVLFHAVLSVEEAWEAAAPRHAAGSRRRQLLTVLRQNPAAQEARH